MIRNTIRAAAGLLATLAIPAGILAASPPASAAAPRVCETNGHHYCLGSANLNLFTAVTERHPGRGIVPVPLGQTFKNHPTYFLVFASDPTKCVAGTNSGRRVAIHACNGGLGTVWALTHNAHGHDLWINRRASGNGNKYLAGLNNGTQYRLEPTGTGFQAFDLVVS